MTPVQAPPTSHQWQLHSCSHQAQDLCVVQGSHQQTLHSGTVDSRAAMVLQAPPGQQWCHRLLFRVNYPSLRPNQGLLPHGRQAGAQNPYCSPVPSTFQLMIQLGELLFFYNTCTERVKLKMCLHPLVDYLSVVVGGDPAEFSHTQC